MQMAVVLQGFPASKLSNLQAEVLETALIEKINPIDGEPVQFVASEYEDGVLTFTCANEATKAWLKETIPTLSPWEGAKLQVQPAAAVHDEQAAESENVKVEGAESDNENMQMAVILEGFPDIQLTNHQAEVLETALVEKINPADSGEPVQFVASKFEDGVLIFTCANEGTKAWLKETVPTLSPWDGAKLKVQPAKTVRGQKLAVWVSSLMRRRTSVEILDLIEKQNKGVSTKEWKLIERKDYDKKASLVLWLDDKSVAMLKSQHFRFHLGLGRVTFRKQLPLNISDKTISQPTKPEPPKPQQQVKVVAKPKVAKPAPQSKFVPPKPPLKKFVPSKVLPARMRLQTAQQPRALKFKGPNQPQPPPGRKFVRPNQPPSRRFESPNQFRPPGRKSAGPWSEGIRIVSKSSDTHEPRVMVINRRSRGSEFAVPDRPPRLKRFVVPEPEVPAIIVAEAIEPRGNGFVMSASPRSREARIVGSDSPQRHESVVFVQAAPQSREERYMGPRGNDRFGPDESMRERGFVDREPYLSRDRRFVDDGPPHSRDQRLDDFGRGERYMDSSRDDRYIDARRNDRYLDSVQGGSRDDRYVDSGRGPSRDDRYIDLGRGPPRDDRFVDSVRGPSRDERFADSVGGMSREDRFIESLRGLRRENNFVDSIPLPSREDRFSGRVQSRDDRYADSGPPPLLGQRVLAPGQSQEQRLRGSDRSDLHGSWVSVASLNQARDLGISRSQMSDFPQGNPFSRR